MVMIHESMALIPFTNLSVDAVNYPREMASNMSQIMSDSRIEIQMGETCNKVDEGSDIYASYDVEMRSVGSLEQYYREI